MSWFESKAGQNIVVQPSSVKLVKSCAECCFADFYYDSKVTVVIKLLGIFNGIFTCFIGKNRLKIKWIYFLPVNLPAFYRKKSVTSSSCHMSQCHRHIHPVTHHYRLN